MAKEFLVLFLFVFFCKSDLLDPVCDEIQSGEYIYPGTESYDLCKGGFHLNLDHFEPYAIVYCESREQVQHAIYFADNLGLQVKIRSGGNSYEGFSFETGGLVVDVSRMNYVDTYRMESGGTVFASIGSGANLRTIYEELWDQQQVGFAGGTGPLVGIGGLATGGGIGFVMRKYGLTLDRITRMEIVLSTGEIVNTSYVENEDLYWALRGAGGGSFGVITEFEYETLPVQEENIGYTRISWARDSNQMKEILKVYLEWIQSDNFPEEMTAILNLNTFADPSLSIMCFCEPEEIEEIAQISGLMDIETSAFITSSQYNFIDAMRLFTGGTARTGIYSKKSSTFVKSTFTDDTIDIVTKYLSDDFSPPAPINMILFDSFGGVISNLKSEDTAFPYRNALASIQIITRWDNITDEEESVNWVNGLRQELSTSPETIGAHINYPNLEISDWEHEYFGDNYEHLQIIKAKYDPSDMFKHLQSIRLPNDPTGDCSNGMVSYDTCGSCVDPQNFDSWGLAGCSNSEIEQCVCGYDEFCCVSKFDDICATISIDLCGCSRSSSNCGNCLVPRNEAGCENEDVNTCVSSIDQFCGTTRYDDFCVRLARCECGCGS